MSRGSPALTAARKEEIVAACAKLYETMSFKEITIKEVCRVPDSGSLIRRIERQNGLHTLEAGEQNGLGSRHYNLVVLDD